MVENQYPQCARCPTKVCENRGGKMTEGAPSFEKLPGVQSHCTGNDSQPRAGGYGHHAGALYRA
jgi:hypothetical protein